MSKPATPRWRNRTANSAISLDRAACRIAVTRVRTWIFRPRSAACAVPSANPRSTASTTSSRVRPASRCCSGAKRTSAYTTPSSARSSAHSRATRSRAAAVCITATVCVNVSRYRTKDPLSAASRNHEARPGTSSAGRSLYPTSWANSSTVPGRSPPSRWSCRSTFGAREIVGKSSGAGVMCRR